MRDLQYLPRFADRWSHLYLEHGTIDRADSSISFHDKDGITAIPIDQVSLILFGPGINSRMPPCGCLPTTTV